MSNQGRSVLDRVRKPEHTGENRCIPCTALNVAIALVVSAVTAIAAVPLAAAVFVLSLLAIYLRGYLVPGTPALTKRYLPDRVLSLFDAHPIEETTDDEGTWETVEAIERHRKNAVDPAQFLGDAGAIEPCVHEDDLCLTDEFARLIERRVGSDGTDPVDRERIAGLVGVEPDSITGLDREYPAFEIGRRVRKWPSEAALVADIVTDDAIAELTGRWADVPSAQRLGMLRSLRSFHGVCPRCGGAIDLCDDTVESCCRSYEVLTIGCTDCGDPLLEFDPNDVDPGPEAGIQP